MVWVHYRRFHCTSTCTIQEVPSEESPTDIHVHLMCYLTIQYGGLHADAGESVGGHKWKITLVEVVGTTARKLGE